MDQKQGIGGLGGTGERFGAELECVPVSDFSSVRGDVEGLKKDLLHGSSGLLGGESSQANEELARTGSLVIDKGGVAYVVKSGGRAVGFIACQKDAQGKGRITQLRVAEDTDKERVFDVALKALRQKDITNPSVSVKAGSEAWPLFQHAGFIEKERGEDGTIVLAKF